VDKDVGQLCTTYSMQLFDAEQGVGLAYTMETSKMVAR
jgi:hypothetical protein